MSAAPEQEGPVCTARAIEWPSPGKVELLEGVALRQPGRRDVVVEVSVTVTSTGTELARFRSLPNALVEYPHRPGFMAAGTVTWSDSPIEVGRAVAVRHVQHQSCVVVRHPQIHPIPAGVEPVDGALWHLGVIALYGLRRGGYTAGAPVAVLGAGIVGAMVRRFALAMGTRDCLVLASSDAKQWTSAGETGTRFMALTASAIEDERERYPLTIDATGAADSLRTAVSLTESGGCVVLLGSPRSDHSGLPASEMQERGVRVVGAHIGTLRQLAQERDPGADVELTETFFRLLADGVSFADLIERRAPAEAREVYEVVAQRPAFVAAAFDWGGHV